jgi:TusA-related sulfurtransferase
MLIDARGLVGQTPITRTAQAMRSVQPGDVVEVVASDAGTFHAFAAWARTTGNELLDSSAFGGTYRFVIRHR